MSEEAYFVYTLSDPRDGSVHYVGISKHPEERLGQHVRCGEDCNPIKDAWILELRQYNLLPMQSIIDTASTRIDAGRIEKCWINHYRKLKAPLTNRSRGWRKQGEVA